MFDKIKNFIAEAATKSHIITPNNLKNYGYDDDTTYDGVDNGQVEDQILIEQGYKGNADVFAILNAISNESNSVKWCLKDNQGEIIEDGEAYDLINSDENEPLNEKINKIIINYGITGDAFLYFVPSIGFNYSRRFVVLRSVDVEIKLDMYNEITGYVYNDGSRRLDIATDDILHIKDYDPSHDGAYKRGLARFNAGYNVLKAGNNREIASANIWENNGVSGLLSDKAGTLQDEDDAKRLQKSLNSKLNGASKAGKVIVTNAELDYLQFGFTPKELSIDKTANDHLRKMASMFNVSSRQFNDPQGSTYNNLEVDSENFFIKGVQPILNKIAQALTTELVKRGYPYYLYLDTSGVQALSKKRRESAEIEIKKGESVISVLLSGLGPKQKISILQNYHGFTEEEATEIVNNGQETTQETQENQGQSD